MITQTKNIAHITPIFKVYLKFISQFYVIKNFEPWCDRAIQNLSIRTHSKEHKIFELRKDNIIIGFAIVSKHLRFNTNGHAISEFYIQEKHTKKGNGRRLAEFIFNKYPGTWEIAVNNKNYTAQQFWRKVISRYTSHEFHEKQGQEFCGIGYIFNN